MFPARVFNMGTLLSLKSFFVQGEPSGSSQPLADIKTKVVFQYLLLILKCNVCLDVNYLMGQPVMYFSTSLFLVSFLVLNDVFDVINAMTKQRSRVLSLRN